VPGKQYACAHLAPLPQSVLDRAAAVIEAFSSKQPVPPLVSRAMENRSAACRGVVERLVALSPGDAEGAQRLVESASKIFA
jgi:hypothetical protein